MALIPCPCVWTWIANRGRLLLIDPFCDYHRTHPPKEGTS